MTNPPWEIPPGLPNLVGAQPSSEPVQAQQPPPGPAPSSPVIVVQPTPGLLPTANLKILANWRAVLHQITPVVVTAMMALHVAGGDSNKIGVYVALFFAVVDPLLSFTNTTDTARKIIYGVLGALQVGGAVGVVLGGITDIPALVPLATAGVTIVTAFLARFFTPTSTMVPIPNWGNNP